MVNTWASSWGVSWGVSWGGGVAPAVTFDGGGIISRASLKRLKRQAEEERKRRESTWEAGLLASRELVAQVTRAMDGGATAAAQQTVAAFIDDEEEEIEMLLMMA